MKIDRSWVLKLMLLSLSILLPVSLASASPIIDFGSQLTQGTVSSPGTVGSVITGTNIAITSLLGIDTPSNNGVQKAVTNGVLAFVTPGITSVSGGVYSFSSGGTITITGNVAGITSGVQTLLTGTFSSGFFNVGTGFFEGSGSDTKLLALTSFYGLPNSPYAFFGFDITTTPTGTLPAFSATPFSTDYKNTYVPEPGSLLLIGSGLLGLFWFSKRKS